VASLRRGSDPGRTFAESFEPELWKCTGVLQLNPAPVAVACEMVTLVPPELVSVSDKVELLPICTLPKLWLDGFAASAPAETPVPERGKFKVGFDASLVAEIKRRMAQGKAASLALIPRVSRSLPNRRNP
jgi:hypothetical protein